MGDGFGIESCLTGCLLLHIRQNIYTIEVLFLASPSFRYNLNRTFVEQFAKLFLFRGRVETQMCSLCYKLPLLT